LGVLAIIAVLSVGGIAGYSKAMEKFKINKATDEYAYLIFGMMEHLDDIKKLDNGTNINNFLQDINLIPKNWPASNQDALGNIINIFLRNNRLTMDLYLGGFKLNEDGASVSANFSHGLCEKFMQNIVIPLHSSLYNAWIHNVAYIFYGDEYCNGTDKKCFNQISLTDINKYCSGCASNKQCAIVLEF
ncbi:MAG TPA: hypothetical protein DD619_01095, partial [Alphaproteobacteria bacterium]|nr:hypothetical protein [Alphaproteobacteria bacterium]